METREMGRFQQRIAIETPESFAESVAKMRLFYPGRKPMEEWEVFHGSTEAELRVAAGLAARVASRFGAQTAARAAFLAAESAAAEDAERYAKWAKSRAMASTAVNAALEAAKERMRLKLGSVTWRVSKDVGWDAELVSALLSVKDLNQEAMTRHLQYAFSRWEVWERGFILLADVGGTFYVYHIDERNTEELVRRE